MLLVQANCLWYIKLKISEINSRTSQFTLLAIGEGKSVKLRVPGYHTCNIHVLYYSLQVSKVTQSYVFIKAWLCTSWTVETNEKSIFSQCWELNSLFNIVFSYLFYMPYSLSSSVVLLCLRDTSD